MNKIVSSIDIGTNTITLLIAEIKNSKINDLFQAEYITALGEGLSKNNLIKLESINRCVKYLTNCKKIIKKYNVEKEFCVATSALRQAKNNHEVISRIKSTGCLPIIISGNEEAQYIGNIVKHEFPDYINNTLVVDIGGGSTEFIYFSNSKINEFSSIDMGSVTLFEKFLSDPLLNDDIKSCNSFIQKQLENSFLKDKTFDNIIGVGGTITSLSAIFNKIYPYNANKIHKSKISINALNFLKRELINKNLLERSKIPVLEYKRAYFIPAGFLIFNQIMNLNDFNELFVCEKGLRWGVLLEQKI